MSDDYFFHRAAERQLSRFNKRNVATVLGEVVKFHNGLKTKVFACGCFGRNLKNLSKFAAKSPCWAPFIVKLQYLIAYKRLLGQIFQKRDTYGQTLTPVLSVNFEKKKKKK